MMRIVLVLTVGCWLLAQAARALGSTTKLPDEMAWFTNVNNTRCDRICLLGITADSRNRDAITAAIHRHPLLQRAKFESSETGVRVVGNASIQLLLAPLENPPGAIFTVQFADPKVAPELGDVMGAFGFPDRVDVVSQTPYLHVLMYYLEHDVVIDSFDRGDYSPHTRVNSITLTDLVRLRYNTSQEARIWRGFIYRAR